MVGVRKRRRTRGKKEEAVEEDVKELQSVEEGERQVSHEEAPVEDAQAQEEDVAQEDQDGSHHDDDDASSESDEEEQENGKDNQMNAQGGKGGRRKKKGGGKGKKAAQVLPPIQTSTDIVGDAKLLLSVRRGRAAIEAASMDWVAAYRNDKAGATAEAATLLLQACGLVAMPISEEDIEQCGADELKIKIEESVKEHGLENILGGRGGKHLKENYRELWDTTLRELGKSGDFHTFVLEKIINLAISLSTSVIREVRRIATITVAQISTSLLFLVAQLHDSREAALAQATGATGGRRGNASEAFKAQAEKASGLLKELLSFVDSIFQSVFATRFRDVDTEIRATIVQSLGRWMILYPSSFLSSTYLKYLAWALSDKDAAVRHASIVAIRGVYEDGSNAIQLKDFTNRFSERIQELMEDKDDTVAVAGTELVTILVRGNHLGPESANHVFNLLSDPCEKLRTAAAELASGMIKKMGKEAMTKSKVASVAVNKKGERKGQSKPPTGQEHELAGVLSILQSLGESNDTENGLLSEQIVYFVVSSLSHNLDSLKRWNLMCEWLLHDMPSLIFGEESTRHLGLCLLCAAQSAIEGSDVKGHSTKERRKAQTAARQEVSLAMQKDLDPLIEKYQTDASMIAIFARMIPYTNIELFSLKRQEANFSKLLNKMKEGFSRHCDPECVLSCAKSIVWCTNEGKSNTRDIAKATLLEIEQECSADLEKAMTLMNKMGFDRMQSLAETFRLSNGSEEPEEFYTIRRAISHVAGLLTAHPAAFVDDGEVQNNLRTLLRFVSEGWDLPTSIIFDAERSLFTMLLFKLASLEEDAIDRSMLLSIKDDVSELISAIHLVAQTALSEKWISTAAASAAIMADVFTVFSSNTLPDYLKEVGYTPLDEDIDIFWNAIEHGITRPSIFDALQTGGQAAISAIDLAYRICCFVGIRQYKQLGAKLLSYWEHPALSPDVSNTFKELVKKLRSLDSTCLPDVYLNAMRICYSRYCKEVQSFPEEERDELAEKAIEPFLLLSHKIANSQAGMNAPVSTLSYIAEKGALYALEDIPSSLEFLQGASFFVVKVKGDEASSILSTLEDMGRAANAPEDTGEEMGDWELFYEYCDVLRSQSQKQKVQGVLKKSAPASTTPKPNRKISFVDNDDYEAHVQVQSTGQRRSRRASTSKSPNYRETVSDDVQATDSDIVSPNK
ncbi:hypothetical protein M9434_005893 [Picochlorum sp. BPE23]|nr:hypothetical protein M9434_005893 [Picochlorum sp. BPE23]